ncbi:hypothetical protein ABK040_012855 [Willaertia magna]
MTRQEIQTSKHFVEDIEHLEGMIEQAILYIHNTNQYIKDLDQLNVDIKSAIREMELKIVELEIYFEEEPLFLKESKEEEFKMKMLNKLSEIRKRISNLKVKQRKANQVYSTKKLNLLRKRNLLLANNELEDENKKNNKLIRKGNQLVTKQSKLVTQSLLRTKSIIETNIERTSTSMDKLNESSSIFQNTLSIHDEYQDKVLQKKPNPQVYYQNFTKVKSEAKLKRNNSLSLGFDELKEPTLSEGREFLFKNYYSILVWSEEMILGIDIIDYQHQRLVILINQLNASIYIPPSRFNEMFPNTDRTTLIRNIFNQILQFTDYSFFTQEYIMESCEYPEEESHYFKHYQFTNKVVQLKKSLEETRNPMPVAKQMIRLLVDWFENHTLRDDRQLCTFLRFQVGERKLNEIVDMFKEMRKVRNNSYNLLMV